MHLKLPETLENYVQQQTENGLYGSASEFIRNLIREHMEKQEERERQKEAFLLAVKQGDSQIEQGKGVLYTPELFKQIAQDASKNVKSNTFTDSQEATPL